MRGASAGAAGEPLDVHDDDRAGLQAQPAARGEVGQRLVDGLAGGADQLGELLLGEVVVDVDAFALQNAYEVNYGIDMARVVVLVNAGASAININIIEGGQSPFTRDISIGGNAYTASIMFLLR